ncbi:ATP-grasp domain-containing protein [Dokdonia sp. Dokd-P16]|uniref:ATP-grasp domain-containing protein n=1 Tax=Dokdonia sp. Dokd-P16 TaxID=2173169 RepID=UPI000D549672|nr:ATP-grasp domain-containing protein [Dokdonia sp. Dokd-P16]AWH73130.1 ATP-grasp domain-containing protein [Dokdonia sp. Dokd-P16]
MFLIDKPFASDFLIATIKENDYPIIATPVAKSIAQDDTLNWIDEQDAVAIYKDNPDTTLYSNSENALVWIEQHLGDSTLARQINILKDKVQFRELTKSLFPDFHFQKLSLTDVHLLDSATLKFPFVIKPSVGFFSIGVHIIQDQNDWEQAKNELHPEKLKSIFPKNVLDTTYFIIEEFIQGEEFAIDYYHNANGEVVILNILHHLFSSGKDTSDRVYCTSKEIITIHSAAIHEFLNALGQELQLKNFPAHAEIRIDASGKITPIEINPLRFGGFCTTGDSLGVTVDFNSYVCFRESKKPNWDHIFKGKEDKVFSIIILDNSTGIPAEDIKSFDYKKIAAKFEKPVLVRPLDIHSYPVFGFIFTETSLGNERELTDILISDLKEYVTT